MTMEHIDLLLWRDDELTVLADSLIREIGVRGVQAVSEGIPVDFRRELGEVYSLEELVDAEQSAFDLGYERGRESALAEVYGIPDLGWDQDDDDIDDDWDW